MVEDVTDLSSLGKFANISDPVWTHLLDTLGKPVNLDDFYAIPTDMLLDGLKAFEFKASDEAPTIKLTLVQIGRLSKLCAPPPRRSRVLPLRFHHRRQR